MLNYKMNNIKINQSQKLRLYQNKFCFPSLLFLIIYKQINSTDIILELFINFNTHLCYTDILTAYQPQKIILPSV